MAGHVAVPCEPLCASLCCLLRHAVLHAPFTLQMYPEDLQEYYETTMADEMPFRVQL